MFMRMEQLYGHYYVLERRTRVEAHEYKLEISQGRDNQAHFKLELIKSGQFGSVGTDWTGLCFFQDFEIKFEFQQKNEWRYTFLNEEREDSVSNISKFYSSQIFVDGNNIQLTFYLETKELIMFKVEKDIERLTYWITREIQKLYDLESKAKNTEKFRFWCISNLIVKDYQDDFIESETFEITCEYDLDLVKEEKRVIDDDEVIREHHIDRIVFNRDYRIIKYDTLG